MKWLIDSDVFIEGQRGNKAFDRWREIEGEFATADIIRAEFLVGVHAAGRAETRQKGEWFYREFVARVPSFSNEGSDYELAARLAGEARRDNRGKPSLADALLGVIALRTGATVATKNLKDFKAMGIPAQNPLESTTAKPAT